MRQRLVTAPENGICDVLGGLVEMICSIPKTITRFVTAPRQATFADGMIRISKNRQVMSRVTLFIKFGTITDIEYRTHWSYKSLNWVVISYSTRAKVNRV